MAGVSNIAKNCGVKDVFVKQVFEEIMLAMQRGETVHIKGFGAFKTSVYPGREISTPKINDGKPFKFPDSVMLKFRQSQTAKQRLNKKSEKALVDTKATRAVPGVDAVARPKPGKPKAAEAPKKSGAKAAGAKKTKPAAAAES